MLPLDVEVLPHGRRGRVDATLEAEDVVTWRQTRRARAREDRTTPEYNIAAMVILALETATRPAASRCWTDGVVAAFAGETDAHARRAAARRDHDVARRPRAQRSPTSTTSRSSPDPDRSRDFASAWPPSGPRACRPQTVIPCRRSRRSQRLARGPPGSLRELRRRPTVARAPCLDGQRGDVFCRGASRLVRRPRTSLDDVARR